MAGEYEDNPDAQVLFDVNDPRLTPREQPAPTPQQREEAFFADPLGHSSPYLPQQAPSSETSPVRSGGLGMPPASAPVVGAAAPEQTQEPLTRDNMGSAVFAAQAVPDISGLAPETHSPQSADQLMDARMGWGAGGSVLVRAAEELAAQDAAKAEQRQPDPASRISRALNGGEAPAGLSPEAGQKVNGISARLAGLTTVADSPEAQGGVARFSPQTRGDGGMRR